MPSNKDRLSIALFARGGKPSMPEKEDTYHWALILGPKKEKETKNPKRHPQGIRFDAINRVDVGWIFLEREISKPVGTATDKNTDTDTDTHMDMLLVRIIIGKVLDPERLKDILRNVPVKQNDSAWNCVCWVRDALVRVWATTAEGGQDVLGASSSCLQEWSTVRDAAMRYVEGKKAQHRFDGKERVGQFDTRRTATLDLLLGKEVVP